MMILNPQKQEAKVASPEATYKDPAQVLHDRKLTWDEKMAALKNWEMDEKAAMTADDENMTAVKPAKPQGSCHPEMLEKIQAAERVLEEMPRPPAEKRQIECNSLTALVVMNIDACIFYRNAAEMAAGTDKLENIQSLEKLHRLVIIELMLALRRNGDEAKDAEKLYSANCCIFGLLCANPKPSLDAVTLISLGHAEESCYEALKAAMDNDCMSDASRLHISCAMHHLLRRQPYLEGLDNRGITA